MKCMVKRVIYNSIDSGYMVCTVTTKDISGIPKEIEVIKGIAEFKAVGYNIPESSEIEIKGTWVDSKYGKQFEVKSCIEILPKSKDGIISYLSSGLFSGIGTKTAEAIYKLFGDKSIETIKSNPKCLLKVKGITEEKANSVYEQLNKTEDISNLSMFLSPFGITIGKAQKIFDKFGAKALSILKSNPYEICKVKGFGFITADMIAKKLNTEITSIFRIKACLQYVLDEISSEGHMYCPPVELSQKAYELLNKDYDEEIISLSNIKKQLFEMSKDREVILENNSRIYSIKSFDAELSTAKNIANIINFPSRREDVDDKINEIQDKLKLSLDELQKKGISRFFESNLSIITGGPGTGKTTILKVITKMTENEKAVLMAPTGRAAQRMSETCGIEATTIHKALGLSGEDYFKQAESIDAKFIIIDESSMLDQYLADILFKCIPLGSRVLIIGDIEQLPSVGPGNVLRELIGSGLIPVTVLKRVYRQSSDSYISSNALYIKNGKNTLDYGNDFIFHELKNNEDIMKKVSEVFINEVKDRNLDSVQILTPSRDKGAVSAKTINEKIRELINPKSNGKAEISFGQRNFRTGDKVMQIKNNLEISNGEVGLIRTITKKDGKSIVKVEFSGNRYVTYSREELNLIQHAYAMTIHKSQGSEYDVVIIVLLKTNYIMLKRNLIYTAITRGKRKVIVIGQKEALNIAINKNDISKRNTILGERIKICDEKNKEIPEKKKEMKEEQLALM